MIITKYSVKRKRPHSEIWHTWETCETEQDAIYEAELDKEAMGDRFEYQIVKRVTTETIIKTDKP